MTENYNSKESKHEKRLQVGKLILITFSHRPVDSISKKYNSSST